MFMQPPTMLRRQVPTLAAVLSFVVYSLSGHAIDPAVIFSSLTLFQLLRMPLVFLPLAASSTAGAWNAIRRLHDVFTAELLTETKVIDPSLPNAVEVEHADFTWDGVPPDTENVKKSNVIRSQLTDLIHESSLTAIVGPDGSGKSSSLQGLIGEMRREMGTVKFGGSVGYCQQSAWIQNATIRENICFGSAFELNTFGSNRIGYETSLVFAPPELVAPGDTLNSATTLVKIENSS